MKFKTPFALVILLLVLAICQRDLLEIWTRITGGSQPEISLSSPPSPSSSTPKPLSPAPRPSSLKPAKTPQQMTPTPCPRLERTADYVVVSADGDRARRIATLLGNAQPERRYCISSVSGKLLWVSYGLRSLSEASRIMDVFVNAGLVRPEARSPAAGKPSEIIAKFGGVILDKGSHAPSNTPSPSFESPQPDKSGDLDRPSLR
jgi:hypothetical protein